MIGTAVLMLGPVDTWTRIVLCIVETVRLMLGLTDTWAQIVLCIVETVRLMLGLMDTWARILLCIVETVRLMLGLGCVARTVTLGLRLWDNLVPITVTVTGWVDALYNRKINAFDMTHRYLELGGASGRNNNRPLER